MRPIPLVVNMFAGPGAGKSTLAAWVFAGLKGLGSPVSVELCTEFAKDLVWEGRTTALVNQAYVLGEQLQRIVRVVGKVDAVITDSPVLLSSIYAPADFPPCFHEFALWCHRRFPSVDVFVERPAASYEQAGRRHDEGQALAFDRRIRETLGRCSADVLTARPTQADAQRIAARVLERLAAERAA